MLPASMWGIGTGAWIILLGIYVIAGLQILGALRYGGTPITEILGLSSDGGR